MYGIINQIIGHAWVSNYSGEQQYVFYGCLALVLILTVAFVDIIRSGFAQFLRK